MSQVFKNGARTELDVGITASTTQFTVIDGTIFPEASASVTGGAINQASGDWFKLVLQDDGGNFEIVYCYGHGYMTHTFTVLRGQDGTTARDFPEGTTVGLRLLSSDLDTIHSTLTLLAETKQEKTVPAAKADALTNARTITLSGAVQANATWDASGALELVTDNIDVSKANGGTLVVGRGGTGATSHTAGQVLVGNGANSITSLAIDTTTSGISASGLLITSGAVNAGLALKANLDSPALSGTPTAPTAVVGANTTQLANTAFVTTAVSNAVSTLLGSAPAAALDTLKELGDALGNDPNFAATITNTLATKVDKVTGKGLSTNDFTTALLNKLNGVADGANNFSLPTGTSGQVLKHNGTDWVAGTDNNTTYSTMSATEANEGTATSARVITADVMKGAIETFAPAQTTITGNAGTATKLATACNLTIGSTAKAFDGSANVSWTLAEIGAADSSHSHSYLPLGGGALTGAVTSTSTLEINNTTESTSATTGAITTTGGVGIGGAMFITGAITSANNITAYSDRRLKKDLVEIDGALAKVKQLTGYTYTRIDTGERQTGLIAQDLQKVLPEAVQENEDHLSVAYGNLVGLLVNSIKELELRVAELEKKAGGN